MVGRRGNRAGRSHVLRRLALVGWIGLTLWGCKSGADVEPAAGDPGGEGSSASDSQAKAVPEKLDGLTLKEKAAAFVIPAPSEIVLLLQEADPGGELLASVGNELPGYGGLPTWKAALALGIANADLLLTVPEAPDEDVVARLDNIAEGMAALVLGGSFLGSGALASESDATACLDQLVANASAQGYRLRNTDTEQLTPTEAHGYSAVFTKGREYLVFACGDAAVRDLDIYLYDEAGKWRTGRSLWRRTP